MAANIFLATCGKMGTVKLTKSSIFRVIGLVGAVASVVVYVARPSWPTGDKLLVFLTFVFMAFGQAKEMLKRLAPFVGALLVYDWLRGLVPHLNSHANFMWMPAADRFIFGSLPTFWLQQRWWTGSPQWYDFGFYGFYMLHFILPVTLAIAVWKLRESHYWQVACTYVTVSLMGLLTFLLFPAAPPWMAGEQGKIEGVAHVSNFVFGRLGFKSFPSVYAIIGGNPVAAVPSLHAAYGTLLLIFVYKLFGKRWALLAAIYPLVIFVGTVYSGEHYAVDEIIGIVYAFIAYWLVKALFERRPINAKLNKLFRIHQV